MKKHIFLTGPTASGKTAIGIALAERLGAEIVSMDSMAVYRGMEIGTAAPSAIERERIPHHLVAFLEPTEEYSVAEYLQDAETAVNEILSRKKRVLFVGGTPLYLKTLLRGLFEGPPADPMIRRLLLDKMARKGKDWLYEKLRQIDPKAAGKLHPNDTRRLIRAIEVYETTGRAISDWQQQFDRPVPREDCRVFVLDRPRQILYDRIDRRVDQMFEQGLLDEAGQLWSLLEPFPKATARQAVGFRELFDHLAGLTTLAEAVTAIKRHTRQFAKRQMTWFRSLEECRFLAADEFGETESLVNYLFKEIG